MAHKVLHVSEAFGGGIVSSLYSFAQNTPDIEHHLLVCERKDEPLAKNLSACFASISPMRNGLLGARADIRRKVAELAPDYVHFHSTFAGLYGRLAGLDPAKLVYSPHGFAFQRASEPKPMRMAYYAVEKLLSTRSANFAGVSLDEVRLSRVMNPRSRSVFIPNVTDVAQQPVGRVENEARIAVVAMGRLCPQRTPASWWKRCALCRRRCAIGWTCAGSAGATMPWARPWPIRALR
jgi:hypothetical protein